MLRRRHPVRDSKSVDALDLSLEISNVRTLVRAPMGAQPAARVMHRKLPMPQTLDGVHVLLVEDDEDCREVMQLIMEYQGALVVPAHDAEAGLAVMATMKPDVLVTDINMPPGDGGIWLLREGRQRGFLEDVPVLAVSALADERLREAGFDAYLLKPVDPNELCSTVQALARRRTPPSQR